MRIYFIGNSFTFFNDLPAVLADMLGCEVGRNLRGGAYLHDRLDPKDALHATLTCDLAENWDYALIQEQSRNPYEDPADYQRSVAELCRLVRAAGAKPVIYETWAYRAGSEKLASTGLNFAAMQSALSNACRTAAQANGALLAKVGQAFHASEDDLLLPDDFHPNEKGTELAAKIIAGVILADER